MIKIKSALFCLSILFYFSSQVFPQQIGSLRGFVSDSSNGEALVNANIVLKGTKLGAVTDVNGFFSIQAIPANKEYKVIVSFMGYKAKTMDTNINPDKITQINIPLSPITIQLSEVQTIGEKIQEKTKVGFSQIHIKELELFPKSVETDVFRALKVLPGIQSTSDVSARYNVRGGSNDQNLVQLNGISIYNPFHAMGLFSIIDPEMINSLEFYKGGYTAEHGGRISSVLNLVTKNGNSNRFSGSSSISLLTGKASLEGPVPGGSFILTGRKSLFNGILKKFFNYKDAPFDFYDYSFKVNFNIAGDTKYSKFSFMGFESSDKLNGEDNLNSLYNWTNKVFGINWFQVWESPIFSEASLSVSNFDGNVTPNKSADLSKTNKVNDITFKMDFTMLFDSKDELKFGYALKSLQSKLYMDNPNITSTRLEDNGANIALYSKYRLLRVNDLVTDIGVRINPATLAKKSIFFEPRVNVAYTFNPLLTIKGAWGIYSQDMVTLTNENEVISLFEPWVVVPGYLNSPSAIHYVLGLDYNLTSNVNLNIEGYYKQMHNLTELNPEKYSSTDPDLISGKGEAYGWEFLLNIQNWNGISGMFSYSLSWTYKNFNNWLYYPRYDARHVGKANILFDLGNEWDFGINFALSSGLPFTELESFYDKAYVDDFFQNWYLNAHFNPYTVLGSKNVGRLPFYHRLDLNLSKAFKVFFTRFYFSVDIINVYNRKNIFYFQRDTGKRVNMLPFLPTASFKVEI